MTTPAAQTYTAFEGHKQFAHGPLDEVVLKVKHKLKSAPETSVLVFSDETGKQMDFDLSGSDKDVLSRLKVYFSSGDKTSETAFAAPGRPKLGVVSREVSLLPRHWEWLSTQSGGASATIRRLIEEARKQPSGKEVIKQAQERTYKFLQSLAGDLPGYEEALRALFSKNKKEFDARIENWPRDIKKYAGKLAQPVF